MRIHIDGSVLSLQRSGGITKYLTELLPRLATVLKSGDSIDLGLYPGHQQNVMIKSQSSERSSKLIKRTERSRLVLARQLAGRNVNREADVVHSPYFSLPRNDSVRKVLTLHDLIGIDEVGGFRASLRRRLLSSAIRRADKIICVSEATRQDLINSFPEVAPSKSVVIYHGVSSVFREVDSETSVNLRFSLGSLSDRPYALYVGNRDGYKNFRLAVQGLASARNFADMRIVCVGGGSFRVDEIEFLKRAGMRNRVMHAGQVDDLKLVRLYRSAYALIYPSKKEGFGLPILEAMAAGCPVICSMESSMGEVAGDAGVFLSGFDPEAFVGPLERLGDLEHRFEVVEKGHKRAKEFSWEDAALRTYQVYCGTR